MPPSEISGKKDLDEGERLAFLAFKNALNTQKLVGDARRLPVDKQQEEANEWLAERKAARAGN